MEPKWKTFWDLATFIVINYCRKWFSTFQQCNFFYLISVYQWRKNGPYTGSFFNRGQPCMILKWQTNNLLLFVYVWHQNCLGSVYHIDRPVNNNKRAFHALSTSKICIKYRKHGSSPFSHTFNCACFSLFLPKKVHIKAKIDLFSLLCYLTSLCGHYNVQKV